MIDEELKRYVSTFKGAGTSSENTAVATIFRRVIMLADMGQSVPSLGSMTSLSGKPLSFFLIDEMATTTFITDIHLVVKAVDMGAVDKTGRNCLHYLLGSHMEAANFVGTLNHLLKSDLRLNLKALLLHEKISPFGSKCTPLEGAIVSKKPEQISVFLETMNPQYAQELSESLNTVLREGKTLGALLMDRGVEASLLSTYGFIQ